MALAAAEPGAVAIDRDQRHQDQVRLDRRALGFGWRIPNGPGVERVAGEEAERLGGIVESREGDDRADRARFLHRQQRADLAAHRRIAADHLGAGAQRGQMLGKAPFEQRALGIAQRRDIRLARVERGAAQRVLGQRIQSAAGRGREVTGPPWPFAGNPLTPQTSGGRHVRRTRSPGRDSSLG